MSRIKKNNSFFFLTLLIVISFIFISLDIDIQAEEISLEEITMVEYGIPVTDISVSGIIKNLGTNNLTSYDVTYNVDGGADVTTYTVTGINTPIGDTHEFTHDIPVNLPDDGNYVINVTVSNPNGVADGTDNNEMSHNLNVKRFASNQNCIA